MKFNLLGVGSMLEACKIVRCFNHAIKTGGIIIIDYNYAHAHGVS